MSIWFDLLIHVFTITTFIAYCVGILTRKYSMPTSFILYCIWVIVLALVSHALRYNPPVRFFTVITVMQLFIFLCFKDKFLLQLRANLECSAMSIVGELVASVMYIVLTSKGLDMVVYDSPGRAIMSLVTTALVACLVPVALTIRGKARFYEIWRVVFWQIAICVIQIAMMLIAFLSSGTKSTQLVVMIAVVQIPGILVSLFCTRTILYVSRLRMGTTLREFEDIKTEMEYDYYKLAIESNAKLSMLRHDMNNTIQTALALIRNGEEAKGNELLKNFEEASRATAPIVHCDNEIVNVILNIKNEEMRRLGINMKVVVTSSLLELPPSDLELTSVLTNLIDNAIEACESVDMGRLVTVCLGNIQGYYIIKVENSCNPFVTVIPDSPDSAETTKNDKELHGFGLRSVCEICKRHNGSFTMYLEGEKVVSVATFAESDCSKPDDDCIIV